MKKVLVIIATIFTLTASASTPTTQVVGISYDASLAVPRGSNQWMDLNVSSHCFCNADTVYLKIKHGNYTSSDSAQLLRTIPIAQVFANRNPDGVSCRVTFTLPAVFPAGVFTISTNRNFGPADIGGNFAPEITTGIKYNSTKKEAIQTNYFTIQGQQLAEPTGRYIEQIIYSDNSIEARQIYKE